MIKYPAAARGRVTRVWESGSGEPVLFLHDAGLRLDWWRNNFTDLAGRELRAVAVDLPGHGFADKRLDRSPVTLPELAAFTGEIISGLGLGRTLLVGAGLGGAVALALAGQRPELVRGLVLFAPLGAAEVPTRHRHELVASVRDTRSETAERRARRQTQDPMFSTGEWLADEININRSPGAQESLNAYADLVDALAAGGVVGEAAGVPGHLFWGERDEVTPVDIADIAARQLNLDLTVLPGAGHAAYAYASAVVDATIERLAKAPEPELSR